MTEASGSMLIQVALNGGRRRHENPAVPVTPGQQAEEARAAVAAGAASIHVHIRDRDGRESLAPEDVASALAAIRAACPGIPIGVSTGAWIVRDPVRRLELVRSWGTLPDYASVNVHEEGAEELYRTLVDRGVPVEAGIWDARCAQGFVDTGLAGSCLRFLMEPAGGSGDLMANLDGIESVIAGLAPPRLLHGAGDSTWSLIELAARRGYDTRVGLEDTLALPDGSPAPGNGALVAAAVAIVERAGRTVAS